MSRIRCSNCHEKLNEYDAIKCWCCENLFCCDCVAKSSDYLSLAHLEEDITLCQECLEKDDDRK